jgi:flagellar biosynthesis protein FlhF
MGQRFYKVKGHSLEEAYRNMRRELGEEAVALSTHQINEGGILGFFGRKMVEITASAPAPAEAPRRAPSPVERRYVENSTLSKESAMNSNRLQEYEALIRDAQRRINSPSPATSASGQAAPERAAVAEAVPAPAPIVPFPKRPGAPESAAPELRRELQEIREMIQVLYAEAPGAGLPPEFAPHYRNLIHRGVSRRVAAALIGAVVKDSDIVVLRDPRVFSERLHFEIRKAVKTTGGIALTGRGCRVAAFCGATGVGKTTNLAKLAALYNVHQRARVALVTTDTYRVAAPEQLRVYANIIGLPMRVANDARETAAALREFQDYDLVLMDTAGGSQFNLEQINELKGIFQSSRPHDMILVLAANTPIEDLRNTVNNFKCLHPSSVLFTKLDETRQYGALFSLLVESGLPLSYVSVGQNVPDDIRVASAGLVANLILEGKEHRG